MFTYPTVLWCFDGWMSGLTPEWRPPPAATACVGAHAGVGFYVYPDRKKDINDDRGWHTTGQ